MDRLREYFRRHLRFTTGLHVVLAALPLTLVLLFLLGLAGVFVTGQETFYGWLLFLMLAGVAAFYATGAIWGLSLLLYRFTHAVRESWPDRLRMTLIRLNIVGGMLTLVQIGMIIMSFVQKWRIWQ